jgi:signal transduction histidine kinase
MHRGPRIMLDERPMLKEALKKNAFYVVKREQGGAQWKAEIAQLEFSGANALIALPIRASGQPSLGVLELYYRSAPPDDINGEFRARLRSIALEIGAMMTQTPETRPTGSLFSKTQQILDLSGAHWLCISLLTGDNDLERIVQCGTAVFLEAPLPQPMSMLGEVGHLFDDEPLLNIHVREPDLPDATRSMLAFHGAEAMLCLPLFIKSKPFGVFAIYSTWEARHFQPDEISLGLALISQAATALENANLYRDLERSLHDLKQAQASLVQAARLSTMGQLAAVVAHQINNPLTTVMVDSELILEDLPPDSPLRDSVLAIRRAGLRAHAVVKRLLSTARRNEPGEEMEWIEVNQTIHNTLELVTTHIERAKVTIEIDLDESAPAYTRASPGHLEDVWLNLLLNGRDALSDRPGARLSILSRRTPDYIEVAVQDNGPGIPPESLDMLFEPFFTTKPLGEGTGLGLYICKQVIDQCQGKITVESVLNRGTVFHIVLPTRA